MEIQKCHRQMMGYPEGAECGHIEGLSIEFSKNSTPVHRNKELSGL
jgi:hypothetical protein